MNEDEFNLSPLSIALDVKRSLEDVFYDFVLDDMLEPDTNTFKPLTPPSASWEAQEDRQLLQLVEEYGRQWTEIARHLHCRTNNSCRNRVIRLKRKIQKNEKRALERP